MSDRAGRIITFYSYKGGTGRTMAISNVAWVLASNGHKVEVIVATRDPDAAKNSLLSRAGVRLIKADMNSPETLLPAIRDSGADTVLLVPPQTVS